MKKIMIVEDDPVFLQRFSEIISKSSTFSLLATASTCAGARKILVGRIPDVLLVDLGLPDGSGVDIIREVSVRHPDMEIMVITVFGDEEHVITSVEAGATGYLLKDNLPEEFIASIQELCDGGSPITPTIARQLLKRFNPLSTFKSPEKPTPPDLSTREIEILRYVAKGFSFKEVAHFLKISPHTVISHVKKIYQKLAVHSRGEAVYKAGRMGLL